MAVALPAATAERLANRAALRQTQHEGGEKAVARAHRALDLDPRGCQPQHLIRRDQHGPLGPEAQGHQSGASGVDQPLRRGELLLGRIQPLAHELAELSQARLDEGHALLESMVQGRTRCIDDAVHLQRPRPSGQLRIEIVGRPGWQAAADDEHAARRDERLGRREALAPLRLEHVGALEHEAILLTGGALVHGERLPGAPRNAHHARDDPLAVEQLPVRLAGRTARGIDRDRLAAEPLDDPRHVHAAAARVQRGRAAAQLVSGDDAVGGGAHIERGIHGERDDGPLCAIGGHGPV